MNLYDLTKKGTFYGLSFGSEIPGQFYDEHEHDEIGIADGKHAAYSFYLPEIAIEAVLYDKMLDFIRVKMIHQSNSLFLRHSRDLKLDETKVGEFINYLIKEKVKYTISYPMEGIVEIEFRNDLYYKFLFDIPEDRIAIFSISPNGFHKTATSISLMRQKGF